MTATKKPWKEIGRKELGLYASGPVRGPGWSNPGYFSIVFEISEMQVTGKRKAYRVRVEHGPPCRMYGEGYSAFCELYKIYVQHARAHTEHHHTGDTFNESMKKSRGNKG